MIKYKILTTANFDNSFKKLDKSVQRQIKKWIDNHLIDVEDPKAFGKPLVGNMARYWRYRIGDYRLLVEIKNKELIIVMINIGHRSSIYL